MGGLGYIAAAALLIVAWIGFAAIDDRETEFDEIWWDW